VTINEAVPSSSIVWTVEGSTPAGTSTITGSGHSINGSTTTQTRTLNIAAVETAETLTVKVTYSGKTATAAVTVTPLLDDELKGTVSVTGTAEVGQTLTANTAGLQGIGAISYVWKRGDTAEADGTAISGAESATYTLTATDVDKYITVTVTRAGYTGSITSAAVKLPGLLEGTVSITGTLKVGETLTADTSLLQGTGAISFVWKRGTTAEADGTAIAGATSAAYTLVDDDLSRYITVPVTRAGYTGSKTSVAADYVRLQYAVGDTGPAGGIIFYASADNFGLNSQPRHYLEAAPADISGTFAWASSGYTSTFINNGSYNYMSGTSDMIGSGEANTARILAVDADAPAAKACADYTYGGKDDWFLPSKNELSRMYSYRTTIGGFATGTVFYWSSTQMSSTSDANKAYAWTSLGGITGSGSATVSEKSVNTRVRAIRAF
jgi:hypothetical protein